MRPHYLGKHGHHAGPMVRLPLSCPGHSVNVSLLAAHLLQAGQGNQIDQQLQNQILNSALRGQQQVGVYTLVVYNRPVDSQAQAFLPTSIGGTT